LIERKEIKMTELRMVELSPVNSRASFYGKAHMYWNDEGERVLRSYNTDVCKVDNFGKFIKLWDGYSMTTMNHINSFLAVCGISGGGKAWWDKQ